MRENRGADQVPGIKKTGPKRGPDFSNRNMDPCIEQATFSDQDLPLRPIAGKVSFLHSENYKILIFRYSVKEGMKKLYNESLNICETVLPDH